MEDAKPKSDKDKDEEEDEDKEQKCVSSTVGDAAKQDASARKRRDKARGGAGVLRLDLIEKTDDKVKDCAGAGPGGVELDPQK